MSDPTPTDHASTAVPVLRTDAVRLGLATNSSSSHSMIVARGLVDHVHDRGEYGWDTFTLASETAKRHYLAAQLVSQIEALWPGSAPYPQTARSRQKMTRVLAEIRSMCGLAPDTEIADYHVDHQSVVPLAREGGHTGPDPAAWARLRDGLLHPASVVLGGNDNGGIHPLTAEHASFPLERLTEQA